MNGVLYKFLRFEESDDGIFLIIEEASKTYKINVINSFPSPSDEATCITKSREEGRCKIPASMCEECI